MGDYFYSFLENRINYKQLPIQDEIKDLVADGAVTVDQVSKLYQSMPMDSAAGGMISGIKEETFLAFNGMLGEFLFVIKFYILGLICMYT